MRSFPNDFKLGISASACIVLALMFLVLPMKWIFAAILAAAFHEFCHAAAVYLCGGRLSGLHFGDSGAMMDVEPMSRGRELFCALAGPVGGLLLLLLARWLPRTAVCAAFHSVYNLLPIYPLDGGRALRCGAEILLPGKADIVCRWIERVCLVAIGILAVYAAIWLKLGFFPILLAFILWFKTKSGKIPCKPGLERVQ